MTARFVTTAPAGLYPAGLVVDVITVTATTPWDPHAADAHADPGGDGPRYRVRHPNGVLLRVCRDLDDLARLGITPAILAETSPRRWPANLTVTCRTHHRRTR
jgi:hypothetical protein